MALRQNALLLLLLTAALAIAGDWSGDVRLDRLWCLPLALLLLGLAYEARIAGRARPRLLLQAPQRWFLGRATPVRFQLSTALARPQSLEIAPTAPPEMSADRSVRTLLVPGRAAASWMLAVTARRLGHYQWPPMQLRLAGVLGLGWWPRSLRPVFALQVVPDILHASERALAVSAGGASAAVRGGAGADTLQLREYRPGDPPRCIDQKASARSGRLISRDFAEDQHLEIMIAVDVGRGSGLGAGDTDRLALYANVAARLAQRAAMLDDQVGLLLYADRPLAAIVPAHGTAAVTRVRSLLAQISVQDRESNPALAALRVRSLVRRRSLVVLLTDLDDASASGELAGAVRLLLPKHLPFIGAVSSERLNALAFGSAADELAVYRALAAQEYRNALARNLAALRALGAPAVLAPPRELDRAVLQAYLGFRQRRRI
jgi:uncharacterized protein (DUF58 family)